MAKSQTTKRDENQEVTRRALIKWTVAAGAALGVSRTKIFEILERTGGKEIAFAAAAATTTRSVHIVGGNGGLAWFQLMWPHVDVAEARNPNFSWHLTGQESRIAGTTKPLVVGADTPWKSLPASRQVSIFQCGNNETHTNAPTSVTNLNGNGIFAVASALQANAPAVIPIIAVGGAAVGTAPGGFTPAAVGNGDGIVNLFNSAASRAGGLLSKAADASLYKAHYDAFTQLNRAANRSTTKASYQTGSSAAQFLGTNLASKLAITPEDLTRYGLGTGTPNNVLTLGRTLIVTVKAFAMGLTNSVVMNAFNDDPHGCFDNMQYTTRAPAHAKVLEAFMADLAANVDVNTQQSLADSTVITIHGDTTKTPLNKTGWGDGTPMNSNVVYVYGAGHLKTGWFGGTTRAGAVSGVNPDGSTAAYNGPTMAKYATASIAYAIAKRDERMISNFSGGLSLPGLWSPKDI